MIKPNIKIFFCKKVTVLTFRQQIRFKTALVFVLKINNKMVLMLLIGMIFLE
jgi:hypothetical protein